MLFLATTSDLESEKGEKEKEEDEEEDFDQSVEEALSLMKDSPVFDVSSESNERT